MTAPPDFAIRAAVRAGQQSPCAKSKRGAAVFVGEMIVGEGFNDQPVPFACTGDARCRSACSKLCEHAEQVALRRALSEVGHLSGCYVLRLAGYSLVHAKVVDGKLAPGGGPSCWQCSRLILAVQLDAVWLYEAQRWHDEVRCGTCSATTVIAQGAGTDGVCERCRVAERYPGLLDRSKTIYAPDSGEWRRYSAEAFHLATLAACGIGGVR